MNKPELIEVQKQNRTYWYLKNDEWLGLRIKNVVKFLARPDGNHRLECEDGKKWIVDPGWQAIELELKEWTL